METIAYINYIKVSLTCWNIKFG